MKTKVAVPLIAAFLLLVSNGFWQYNSLLESMWDFLVVDEQPELADVIIVLGGGKERIGEGVRFYRQGYAPKIILSGDASHWMENQALSSGVPATDIIPERKSRTTFENAIYSVQIMEDQDFRSAIVVTSAYHTRRSRIIFSRFLKDSELTVCAAPYDSSIASSWWRHSQTTRYVITEYIKLMIHYLVEIPVYEIYSIIS